MSTFQIIVCSNSKLFREYFNAISAFFGTGNFSSLLNITILLATTTVCYSYVTKRSLMVLIKWFGLFYIAVYMLFTPRASVEIIDGSNDINLNGTVGTDVNGSSGNRVDHVPFGLAVLASYTSSIGFALTQAIESNFTMPDYMPYHKTGMVFASSLVSMANQFEITDSIFDGNLQEFIHQCVFYDILFNKYSANDLLEAPNIWNFISGYASSARAFVYNGSITTCSDGAKKLTEDWKKVIASSMKQYSQHIYPYLTHEKAEERIISDLKMSYHYLTNVSAAADDIMKQNLMSNAIQRGVIGMGASLDASAAIQSYAFTRAQEQKRLTNQTVGEMAAYWLPLIQIAIQAILYGSFIFVVLLSVFPFGGMVLKNYVCSLLWINIWPPLFAIINLIVSYYAQSHSVAATNGSLSLHALSGMTQINSDMMGLAGYLSMSVPFIASGIIMGMHRALAQGAQYMGGVIQSSASSAVGEAVTGNLSFGNTSFGNHNLNNTTANHVDTSGRVSSGMITSQMAGGSFLSTSADGTSIMDMRSSISNLGTSIKLSDSLRNSYSLQAERAETAANSDSHTYSQSTNAALRNMYDLSHHLNQSSASGDSWSISSNTAAGEAINENDRLTKEFALRHNLSYHDAASVLANAYVDGKLSGGISAGAGGGISPIGAQVGLSGSAGYSRSANHTSGTDNGSLYSDAESYVHDTNYSKNTDMVLRASKDHSLRLNNEEGNRMVDSMGASFDKAESARHDMNSHYQEAQSARENAAYVKENAASIEFNASQEYSEWIANQPGTNGIGRMGYHGAERVHKNTELSQHYANQFLEQYKTSFESDWNHGLVSTKTGIHQQFANNKIDTDSTVGSFHEKNKNQIIQQSYQEKLIPNHFIDTSAKTQTEQALSDNKHKILDGQKRNSEEGNRQKEKVYVEEARKRHGGLTRDLFHDVDTQNHS